jgi:uncharacterized protein YbaP (TraB family)
MMKRATTWMTRRIVLALLLMLAGLTAAQAQPPVPLLWKVSDADNAVYLLGSFHLLHADDYPLSADVEAAFAASDRLMFERAPEEIEAPDFALTLMQAARREGPGTLEDDLGPILWARLEGYADRNGLPLAQLSAFDPWFVGMSITMTEMGRQGLDPALGLDRHFMRKAAAAGKPAAGLERAAEQIAVLADMDRPAQRQLLAEALDQADDGATQTAALHDAWRRGDADALWTGTALQMKREYPALYRRINVERNQAWVPALEQELARTSGDTLVVVGALHLLGEDGVVALLQAKGHTVERICSACAPTR